VATNKVASATDIGIQSLYDDRMKHILCIVGLLALSSPVLADSPPPSSEKVIERQVISPSLGLKKYPNVPFATVKAFGFNLRKKGRPDCQMPVNPDGTLCKSVEKPGVVLNEEQQKRLLKLLGTPRTFGEGESKCFIPHHAFVFYDKDGKAVGQVSICFMCVGLRANPPVAAQPKDPRRSALGDWGMKNLRQLCHDLKLPACDKKSP
jgi:hypothetical protein